MHYSNLKEAPAPYSTTHLTQRINTGNKPKPIKTIFPISTPTCKPKPQYISMAKLVDKEDAIAEDINENAFIMTPVYQPQTISHYRQSDKMINIRNSDASFVTSNININIDNIAISISKTKRSRSKQEYKDNFLWGKTHSKSYCLRRTKQETTEPDSRNKYIQNTSSTIKV